MTVMYLEDLQMEKMQFLYMATLMSFDIKAPWCDCGERPLVFCSEGAIVVVSDMTSC